MPVYLCKPGVFALEPWRHGISVYSEPFALGKNQEFVEFETALAPATATVPANNSDRVDRQDSRGQPNSEASSVTGAVTSNHHSQQPHRSGTLTSERNIPVRRIRHSEVVLVDDVTFVYGNYWLRLRSPGSKGGSSGYICLIAGQNTIKATGIKGVEEAPEKAVADDAIDPADASQDNGTLSDINPGGATTGEDASRAPSPGYYAANSDNQTIRCLRTGLIFPSSPALKLLSGYDDGLVPPVALPSEGQPVFCRICRDGLHDDDGEQQEVPTEEVDNPLMAPCECSGSMAFVHYLCVEQWRCRSRHPGARNGTHCETCFKPYALPPPSNRTVSQVEEEWLEAMPPHVMAALRQPHLGWQIGAALVRKRWLRPLVPVLVSPLVALYCRARRLLKKRGVSRRRWACSLCRRRARWKCVRCLRSYYCSRQCQNVSWHIVHKHVCYKPSRFWWSVVVYGGLILFFIPGILKDPLLYDVALSVIPPSFYIMAVMGGTLATAFKRLGGMDIRGRALELIVVALTMWLLVISWGIVWAFFGRSESCFGMVGGSSGGRLSNGIHRMILNPARTYFLFWDRVALRFDRIATWLCTSEAEGTCFPYLGQASPYNLIDYPKCTSDLELVATVWLTAGVTLLTSALWRKRRRNGGPRPHDD